MTGLFDSAPIGNVALRAQGTSALPSTTGQVMGAELAEGFAHAFPTFEAGRATAEEGIDPDSGLPLPEGTFGPILSADEADQTRSPGRGDGAAAQVVRSPVERPCPRYRVLGDGRAVLRITHDPFWSVP